MPRTVCDGHTIREVRVQGNRRVADEDVRVTMGLGKGTICSDAELAKDVKALWELDFFDDIVVDVQGSEPIILTVIVRERPSISKISFEGNDAIDDSDITEKLSLKTDTILSITEVQTQVNRIRDLYAEKGYFLAKVDYTLRALPDNEVDVHFKIKEDDKVSVRSIRFIGNKAIKDGEIRDAMQTKQTQFWSFLSSGNNYKRSLFEEDTTRIQVVYYDQGYLNVQVGTPKIEITPDRKFIDIAVPISEGPRFKVSYVTVEEVNAHGERVKALRPESELRSAISLQSGDWFSRAKIAKDIMDVRRIYRDAGYANVNVEPGTDMDPKARTVGLKIQIVRGQKVYIERINITGNTRTRDKVIRREFRIDEGDLYSESKVEKSKSRVTALGYFERVELSEEQGSDPQHIILNVEVAERPTGTFQVGAGFSSFESFIFTAQVQQQNLFGQGQTLGLQLQLSGIRQLAQIQFIEPYFLDTEWTLGVDAYKTVRVYQSFNRDSTGADLTFGHPIFLDDLRLFLRYRAEYVDISNQGSGFFQPNTSAFGANAFQRLPIYNLYRSGLTSSVQLSVTWDSRNNRLFPSDGVFTSYSTEVAAAALGSTNQFIRHRAFFRYYRPLIAGLVFKLNTEWGLISSPTDQGVPIFERFFLGGIFNVRGFNFFSLGPRAGIPTTTDPNAYPPAEGVVIGGNMQAFYNMEVEFPILESVGLKGVVFTDGGNAWNTEQLLCQVPKPTLGDSTTDPCSTNILNIRNSWGFGLRWISPLGPLRFEWGFPFKPRPYEPGMRFDFNIGNFF